MSINQAAIHYNLPYSSLYGRFKRGKYDTNSVNNSNVGLANTSTGRNSGGGMANTSSGTIEIIEHSPENSVSIKTVLQLLSSIINIHLQKYLLADFTVVIKSYPVK